MDPINFGKKKGNETTIVSLGSKGGETKIFRKDGRGLLQKLKTTSKQPLGPKLNL